MAFEKKVWEDGEAGATPITAEELNRIEDGIDEAIALDSKITTMQARMNGLETRLEALEG